MVERSFGMNDSMIWNFVESFGIFFGKDSYCTIFCVICKLHHVCILLGDRRWSLHISLDLRLFPLDTYEVAVCMCRGLSAQGVW
jgi:hypothetical protein